VIRHEEELVDLTNKVKQTLRNGGTAIGTFVPWPSPEAVEVAAIAGFDFVLFDAEHGPISPESAYPMLLAAEAHGVTAVARVGQNDRQVILKFLDLGIAGVLIPQTNTPEAVAEAVRAMRYFPDGIRGLAGGRTFSYGLSRPAHELVPEINERVLAMVQFENIAMLDHLEAILETPGLDVLFVGPNDLAQSMGYPGQPGHPEVQAVIDRVCAIAKSGPVTLGTVAPDAPSTNRQLERGFRMVASNIPGLLARACADLLAGVKRDR
jgi:4-hydroxy-2-oxoheptanedioate aldolase